MFPFAYTRQTVNETSHLVNIYFYRHGSWHNHPASCQSFCGSRQNLHDRAHRSRALHDSVVGGYGGIDAEAKDGRLQKGF